MQNIGIVGWRGMVGSVLMQRMDEEMDFDKVKTHFFSTSQAGKDAPQKPNSEAQLLDAYNLNDLASMDIIITAQGSGYTEKVHKKLRTKGWRGYWIDASSSLRYEQDSILVLDPVNQEIIDEALNSEKRDFIGANCTVSTMLMGMAGLLKYDLVEWISSATYQAASGAGAKNVKEMLMQMQQIGMHAKDLISDPSNSILDIDRSIGSLIQSGQLPHAEFGAPLAGNILPWIDYEIDSGQSREEWKAMVETNKLLGTNAQIPVDGTCVRVSAMRSHSQALTIKLKKALPLDEIKDIISGSTEWTKLINNSKNDTLANLTPAAVSGTLSVSVGRLRKLKLGDEYLNVFVVGDQLLWGAAEPLRRMLNILL